MMQLKSGHQQSNIELLPFDVESGLIHKYEFAANCQNMMNSKKKKHGKNFRSEIK